VLLRFLSIVLHVAAAVVSFFFHGHSEDHCAPQVQVQAAGSKFKGLYREIYVGTVPWFSWEAFPA
jgi:hypothetical protein